MKPPTAPKSGFGFSLKTKNPVPPASKAKPGLEESERPEPVPKESPLAPKAKVVAPAREASPAARNQEATEIETSGIEVTTAVASGTTGNETGDMTTITTGNRLTEMCGILATETLEMYGILENLHIIVAKSGTSESHETETCVTRET